MTAEHKFWNLWNGRDDVWRKFGPMTPREAEIATQFATAYHDARYAELLKAIYVFRETAGKHEGEHRSTLETCGKCNEAYVFAENELYRHLDGGKR